MKITYVYIYVIPATDSKIESKCPHESKNRNKNEWII